MAAEPPVLNYRETDAGARIELLLDGLAVSRLDLLRFEAYAGAARLRIDGVSDVYTEVEHRGRGYARLVLEEAARCMRAGVTWEGRGQAASLSLLYGIPDLYPKFGFAVAGPDQLIVLEQLERGPALPPGWRARPGAPADLPAIRALYEREAAGVFGALKRREGGRDWPSYAWGRMAGALARRDGAMCRVVERPDGAPAAYLWRCEDAWFVRLCERYAPDTLALAEVVAGSPAAADAALAVCRAWVADESRRRAQPVRTVTIGAPHAGLVGRAAARQDAKLIRNASLSGGLMVRALDVGRLLEQLRPELELRLRAAWPGLRGAAYIGTEIGGATLRYHPEGLAVERGEPPPDALRIALPQAELARLALGGFDPEDTLARLDPPPEGDALRLLVALFPQRAPFLYAADRP